MGLSFGGSTGSTSSQSNSSGSQSNLFSGLQTALQGQLGSTLSSDLSAAGTGQLSPGVTAGETAADDQINKTGSAALTRTQQMLAARGFGSSGTTGQATLQSGLNTAAGIGNEAGVAQGQQQNLNQANLLSALNYAFTSLGSSATGASTGSSSGSALALGAGV